MQAFFSILRKSGCRTTIHVGQWGVKKEVQEDAKSVIVELLHKTVRKELTLRGNYNTGYELQAIPNEICNCSWSEQSQPKV